MEDLMNANQIEQISSGVVVRQNDEIKEYDSEIMKIMKTQLLESESLKELTIESTIDVTFELLEILKNSL